jgi:hypothetical protein
VKLALGSLRKTSTPPVPTSLFVNLALGSLKITATPLVPNSIFVNLVLGSLKITPLVHAWNMHGARSMHGICKAVRGIWAEYVGDLHGVCMEQEWNEHGICMEHARAWEICVEYALNVTGISWNTEAICMEYA